MTATTSAAPRPLVVVIPAYNAEATLPACLDGLAASARVPDEVVLANDGSTDTTAAIAASRGIRVIGHDGPPRGPAAMRNAGVAASTAALLVFVDADVVVHPDALGRLEAAMDAPGVVAAFGSYDDRPASQRLPALYANLRHHFVHQRSAAEAHSFWAGLGAIERQAFLAAGGFDPAFRQPSIEDIELGLRLKAAGGRIRLEPSALGTHHKDWGLWQLWRTDITRRAAPWSRLIASGRAPATGLNLVAGERWSAVASLLLVLALAAMLAGFSAGLPVAVAALASYGLINRQFLALLARRGGVRLGLAGLGLHLAYHLYASVTFVAVSLSTRLLRASQKASASTGSTQTTRDW